MVSAVRLTLTPTQFMVINELLQNVVLGSRNHFESQMSDLVISMEEQGLDRLMEQLVFHGETPPLLTFSYNNEDGVTIEMF